MGETTVEDAAAVAAKSKPTIAVPPRGSMDSLFTNGLSGLGFSPGPMTLVSGFFAEQGGFSFSQLLAGAIVSPIAGKQQGFLLNNGLEKDEKVEGKNDENDAGYKRNRPVNLVVAQPQPLFMVPPGLSPSGLLNSPGFLSPIQSPFGMSHQQALAHVTARATFSQSYIQMQAELQHSSSTAAADSEALTQQTTSVQAEPESSKIESSEVSQSDKRAGYGGNGEKPGGDGYNWRKYGQKHVKASECPRSYYKCTHLNCPVKKKVERSADGRISEIVYKGHHNHDPPQNSRRAKDSSSQAKGTDRNRVDVAIPETTQHAFRHNDEMEDNVVVIGDGVDDEQPVAKRRAVDAGDSVKAPTHQTTTESKIVVQTRSEVDLLDDGYKWRKYGQKVVKGNPHPRSYYRCTYSGCNVRKHVERSSADSMAVITTYEGKHKHEIPMGRYSQGQQMKTATQKVGETNRGMDMDMGNTEQHVPLTLHLKEEQIAA